MASRSGPAPSLLRLILAAGLLFGACAAPRTPLLTYPTDAGASPALIVIDGRVEMSPNSPCLQLKPTGYPPIALAFPPGYTATFQPLRVYDPAGSLVASEGEMVAASGTLVRRENPGCRTESTLLVVGMGPPIPNAN